MLAFGVGDRRHGAVIVQVQTAMILREVCTYWLRLPHRLHIKQNGSVKVQLHRVAAQIDIFKSQRDLNTDVEL